MVENALKNSILEKFRPGLEPNIEKQIFDPRAEGPLSSLGPRIYLAYALDLVGPVTFEDLKLINIVRNAFAHAATPIGFDDEEVIAVCNLMNLLRKIKVPDEHRPKTVRDRYMHTVSLIVARLVTKLKSRDGTLTFTAVKV